MLTRRQFRSSNVRAEGIGRPAWIAGLLGRARHQLGDSGDEVEELLRVASQEHFEFGVDYANLLRSREAYADAIPLLRDLVANDVPGSAIVLGNLLDDELDDPEGAIEAYRVGIEQGDSHGAYNLAILYHHRGAAALAKSRYAPLEGWGISLHGLETNQTWTRLAQNRRRFHR